MPSSNVNINKSSPADYNDNPVRLPTAGYAHPDREYQPPVELIDWRVVLARVVAALVGYIIYSLWKTAYCWSGVRYGQCEAIAAWEPRMLIGGIALGVVLMAWHHAAKIQIVQAQAHRTNLVLDRYRNPMPADLFSRMDGRELLPYLMARYAMDTQLEKDTAEWKRLWSVNTLSGDGQTSISTHIAPEMAAPSILAAPTDRPLLRDWKERKLICQSENTLLLGFDKSMGSIDPASGMYLQLGEKSDAALLAVSGDSGGGKTSTMRFLLAQAAMNGSQLVLCDPHGRHNEQSLIQSCGPLATSYLLDPALSWDDIHAAVAAVDTIGRARIDHGGPMPHIVLVLDEFNDIACNAPDFKKIADLLKNIARSYRKVNITALLVIHNWRVSEWQDGTLRDAVQGVLFHKMAKSEAQLYISDVNLSKQVAFLPHGDAMYFKRGQTQPTRLTGIPFVPKEELERARELFLPVARYTVPPQPAPYVVTASAQPSPTVRTSVPVPPPVLSTRSQIAWYAANTDLSTRSIRDRLSCDYNLVVDIAGKVRSPAGAELRKQYQRII